MSKYIDAEKLIAEIEKLLAKAKNDEVKAFAKKDAAGHLIAVTKTAVCVKIKKLIASLQQEQSKKRLIQVKCLYPHDESWQKNKVYTCEVWRHGDLNRDFWDVYYDYGKDPKYVQFPTIELLNEEFIIIQEESIAKQDQPEVDLEKEIETYFHDWIDDVEENVNPNGIEISKGRYAHLNDIEQVARHFWNNGYNTRKEE